MGESGYYYLHSNGDLIYKNPVVVESDPLYFESDFIIRHWKMDFSNRQDAWIMILESLALGADLRRVKDLAGKWEMTFEDSLEMLRRANPKDVNNLMRRGMSSFVEKVIEMDLEEYWEKVKDQWERRW